MRVGRACAKNVPLAHFLHAAAPSVSCADSSPVKGELYFVGRDDLGAPNPRRGAPVCAPVGHGDHAACVHVGAATCRPQTDPVPR